MVKLAANGRYCRVPLAHQRPLAGDTNTADDVFVRDLQTQTTLAKRERAMANGSQGHGVGRYHRPGRRHFRRWPQGADALGGQPAGDGAATAGYRWYLRDLDAGVTRLVAGSEDGQGRRAVARRALRGPSSP